MKLKVHKKVGKVRIQFNDKKELGNHLRKYVWSLINDCNPNPRRYTLWNALNINFFCCLEHFIYFDFNDRLSVCITCIFNRKVSVQNAFMIYKMECSLLPVIIYRLHYKNAIGFPSLCVLGRVLQFLLKLSHAVTIG